MMPRLAISRLHKNPARYDDFYIRSRRADMIGYLHCAWMLSHLVGVIGIWMPIFGYWSILAVFTTLTSNHIWGFCVFEVLECRAFYRQDFVPKSGLYRRLGKWGDLGIVLITLLVFTFYLVLAVIFWRFRYG